MKKFLLFAGVAATGLTSCTSDEVVDISKEDAVVFRTTMALNDLSRGQETTTQNIGKFKVTAIDRTTQQPLFESLLFTESETKDAYVSDPEFLWYKDADLDFYAYSYHTSANDIDNNFLCTIDENSNRNVELTLTWDQRTINNFYPQPKVEDQIDLVVAQAHATYAERKSAVSLNFKHILTEVHVEAKTDNQVYDFYVKGIKLCNIRSLGNYDFDKGKWDVDENYKSTYKLELQNPLTLNSTPQNISNTSGVGYPMLIPQDLKTWSLSTEKNGTGAQYIAVKLRIVSKETQMQVFPLDQEYSYAWACIPIHAEKLNKWLPGHRVKYVLDFTNGAGYTDPDPDPDDPDTPDPDDPDTPDGGDPILEGKVKFTISVSEWTNDPDVNIHWTEAK